MSKKYFWLKLKQDFFKEKELKKLRKIAGGDTYTVIYLKLCLFSMNNDCKLIFDEIEDSFAEQLALEIDEDVENIKFLMLFLIKNKLAEEISENELFLTKISENVGNECDSAARVRKMREQKLLHCNTKLLHDNNNVTSCNKNVTIEIEIDKDKEIDIDKDKKHSRKKSATLDFARKNDNILLKSDFENAIDNFILHRKNIKKKLSQNALELLLKKLETLSNSDENVKIQILENSILNGWSGIFELKNNNNFNNNNTKNGNSFKTLAKKYEEEENDKKGNSSGISNNKDNIWKCL
jgi:predicted phage replisome organizer